MEACEQGNKHPIKHREKIMCKQGDLIRKVEKVAHDKEEEVHSSTGSSNNTKKVKNNLWMIFMHADVKDMWLMSFGVIGAVGSGISTPLMFVLASEIINNMGNGHSSGSLLKHSIDKNVVNFLYLACWSFVLSFLEGYCWTRTGHRQASRIRGRYLKSVLRQDIEYFDLKGTTTSDVITSVSSDNLVIQDVLSEKLPEFIKNSAMFLGSYIVAFILEWRLALVAFPTVVLLIIPGLMYGRMLMSLARKIREEYNNAGAIAEQAISSIRTVYSFVAESKTMTEFSTALNGSLKLGVRQGLIKGIAIGSNGITFAIWAFMAWYGSHLVMYHGSQGGSIHMTGVSIVLGGLAFGSGLSNVKYFAEAIAAGERIIAVIKRVPKIDMECEGDVLEGLKGQVEFKGVEFAYPSRPENQILKDFNLKVPAGTMVALVGSSGSGKSTVITLLERFYDPTRGQILIDGVDIKKVNLKWLRSQMGMVSQEPTLFATTIKENILLGKEDATMEEVVAAAEASNAHRFISELPQGYNTQVGESGIQMSGGQKQRIAIARAILRSPKILVLDEATSALDSESERIVQEALNHASVGLTTMVIAHRLSTIRNADIIAVVQGGRVMETGCHNDLMCNDNSIYSSLVRMQQTRKERHKQGSASSTPLDAAIKLAQASVGGRSNGMCQGFSTASRSPTTALAEGENPRESRYPEHYSSVPSFWRMFMLNKPEWKNAVFGCLSSLMFGGVQPLYAITLGSVISVYFQRDHDEIKKKIGNYSLIFVLLSLLSFLINIMQHYNFGVMGENLTKRVREHLLSKMLSFEVSWFDQEENSTGAMCSRLANDAYVVRSVVGDRIALLVQTLSAITIAWSMSLIVSWRLALVIIAVQPIIIASYYARNVLLKSMSSKSIKAQSESNKFAVEAVSNVRTVTAFSCQDHVVHLFELAQQDLCLESIRQSWLAGIVLGTSESLMCCTWALAFWYGTKLMFEGTITSKSFFQTFIILITTGKAIADAGSMTTDLAKGSYMINSVFDILDRTSSIKPEDPNGIHPQKLNGGVEILEVDFAYPTRPNAIIFRGFSLTIEAGKSIALVGQSGSGKSTIIGLVERFYDPLRGIVKIDGKDIKSYNLRSLRRHIALVGQEPVLFSGNIRENIAYGAEDVTEAEVEDAARRANAHDFISGLIDGYDTWCGDGGNQLSGGQKQRIAIARAILKNPTILLLDEATSALDSQSEKEVQQALQHIMAGRTSVVIAHRLNTIENCDLIVVLENGAIVEKGTHDSLLAKGHNGSYYGLVSLQQCTKDSLDSIAIL